MTKVNAKVNSSTKVNAGRHSSATPPPLKSHLAEVLHFLFPDSAVQLPLNVGPWLGLRSRPMRGKNRSSSGEHLSVGGEQQTSQSRRRDWQWARRAPRNRQLAGNVQRSPGDALWAPAVI